VLRTSDPLRIGDELAAVGITFDRLEVRDDVDASSSQEQVLDSYAALIERLCASQGYTLVDVAQLHLTPESPEELLETATAARARFLNEHTHDEEEIRFFAHGSGVFYLHIGERVLAMLCTKGDLLSVPALTTHWFDMGTLPDFTAIRFFRSDDGWVGSFTGSDIASRFPTFDELTQAPSNA
jgi:1,2-dihydroxy-3-keto-5-methylthiopentene dioxygenase